MTPQLQQAIRLLQLSTLELKTEIQEALETNPLLEMAEEGESSDGSSLEEGEEGAPPLNGSEDTASSVLASEEAITVNADGEAGVQLDSDIPAELPVDTSWDDVYDSGPATGLAAPESGDRVFESQERSSESLREHLDWQLGLTPFSDTDRVIASSLIDAIDEDGYLSLTLEDILQSMPEHLGVEMDEVQAVLHRIQNFDPPGVGARDLRECLLLQLQQQPQDTAWLAEAKCLVADYMQLLGNRDFPLIMRRMKLSEENLSSVLQLIQSLYPRPGNAVFESQAEYIVPDVIVRKHQGAWRVELNEEAMPRLRINAHYAGMIRRADTSADNTYIKGQLQEARWFIKSLQSRNETLLKVASCIVEQQRGFLEHGDEAMQAMVLHDVAEAVSMHESTISRVTTKKYMMTPRGIFELKYFFSSHVGMADGGSCSATAIRALIKKLIAVENQRKPLSDSKIADILCSEQGINVARRTVAKYREGMSIPPSNERKRLV